MYSEPLAPNLGSPPGRQKSFSHVPQQAQVLADHLAAVRSDMMRQTEKMLGLIAELAQSLLLEGLSELQVENENLRNELASSRAYTKKQETGGTGDTAAPPGRVTERLSLCDPRAQDDEDIFFEHSDNVRTSMYRQKSPVEPPGTLPSSVESPTETRNSAILDTSSTEPLRSSALAEHPSTKKSVNLPPVVEDPKPPCDDPPSLKVSRSKKFNNSRARSRELTNVPKANNGKRVVTERQRIWPTEFHGNANKDDSAADASPQSKEKESNSSKTLSRAATKVFGTSGQLMGSRPDKRASLATGREPQAVFADVTMMKERVREAVRKHDYNVADFYWEEGFAQALARSQYYEWLTLSVIAFNAIWIAIDMDHNDKELLVDADPIFQVAEHSFCIYFTFEWLVRFSAFRVKWDCRKDAWFCFDTCLVIMMILETWVMNLIVAISATQLGNTSVFKLVRLVRLTRMARMAKLLHAVPELIILIKGIAVAARTVFFTLLLLAIIIYFFAIVFRQLTDDTEIGDRYFPSVTASMGTLLLDGVIPDQALLVRENDASNFFLGMLVVMFILLATLTVMNMLVGVLCEVVSVVSAVEKEQLTVSCVKQKLMKMFDDPKVDTDGNCSISRKEFENLLVNEEAASIIQDMGVDVVGLVDFADIIFEDDIELTFGDFMELVLQLRGSNMCTVKDIVDLRKFVVAEFNAVQAKFDEAMVEFAERAEKDRSTSRMSVRGSSSAFHASAGRLAS
mmetsp:Transcript_153973/g.273070  ORF Transcript_153973/g.273070 Transcript_153973/m.273070 type:complete len:739 (+) Transcript_153973:74-2290(+)